MIVISFRSGTLLFPPIKYSEIIVRNDYKPWSMFKNERQRLKFMNAEMFNCINNEKWFINTLAVNEY